jgi:hypothetical protein
MQRRFFDGLDHAPIREGVETEASQPKSGSVELHPRWGEDEGVGRRAERPGLHRPDDHDVAERDDEAEENLRQGVFAENNPGGG